MDNKATIWVYLKALTIEWMTLTTGGVLAVGFFIVGAINNSYFGWQSFLSFLVLLLALVGATYKVWKKEYISAREAATALKELSNTRPLYSLTKVNNTIKNEVDVETEQKWLKSEIEYAKTRQNPAPAQWPYVDLNALVGGGISKEDWLAYIKNLERYRQKLLKHEALIAQLKYIGIDVKNIGRASGSDISVQLKIDKGSILYDIPSLSRPSRPSGSILDRFTSPSLVEGIALGSSHSSGLGFRREIVTSDSKLFEVNINRLHPGQDASLRIDGFYIKAKDYPVSIAYLIHSTGLTEPQDGVITVE